MDAVAPAQLLVACPACGMAATVPHGTRRARCGACGTVVEVAQPVGAFGLAAGGATELAPDRVVAGLAIGLCAPLVVGVAFFLAHAAIDQADPDTGTATAWALAAVLFGAVSAASPWLVAGRAARDAWWGLLTLVPAFWLASTLATSYGPADSFFAGLFLFVFVLPLVGASYLGLLIVLVVQASRDRLAAAVPGVLAAGAGGAAGIGLAAAWYLVTLQQQVASSREAHEAPGLGLIAAVVVLVALALAQRRRP